MSETSSCRKPERRSRPARGATLAEGPGEASAGAGRDWPRLLAAAERDLDELWRRLALPGAPDPAARRACAQFPLLVPEPYLARMRRGDRHDPLLLQVLPVASETVAVPGYHADPVGESACAPTPGLLRKYRGRALVVATGACAVHCRYCFRRHYPYGERERRGRWWADLAAHIAADPSLEEVILSGGDPLVLPDSVLGALIADCTAADQIRRLRIHTRLPVVLPQRVDDGLVATLLAAPVAARVVVIHANHPREIDPEVAAACRRLAAAGVQVLNQAVLLAGINDIEEVLAELGERLLEAGVLPYYLHQLDPVAGAAHFAVSDARAGELVAALRRRQPGYLVPRLVREVPGAAAKTPL